jgi:hypothetical protein
MKGTLNDFWKHLKETGDVKGLDSPEFVEALKAFSRQLQDGLLPREVEPPFNPSNGWSPLRGEREDQFPILPDDIDLDL